MQAIKHAHERNARIVVSLLKQHGVKNIIVSPGSTNLPVVVSVQHDPYFHVYSCVDERSAAYMACGMAATTGEPVALSCTGATASRNYLPGLTEAYYRKLPVIAITSFNGDWNIGQLLPQTLDRRIVQNDVALVSVDLPVIKDETDALYCNRLVNQAILESIRHGGGPVHINLPTVYDNTMDPGSVPVSRCIRRYMPSDPFPEIGSHRNIVIHIGAHIRFSKEAEQSISDFADRYDAVVLCDHTSNYHGHNRLLGTLTTDNLHSGSAQWDALKPDLVISMGEISGDYPTTNYLKAVHAETWRVSLDGELRDRFDGLTKVFECDTEEFFKRYAAFGEQNGNTPVNRYFAQWEQYDESLRRSLPDLPYSGRWIAEQTAKRIPEKSIMHFAILNALRSWNYFELNPSIRCYCNTGGFGIDGALSTTFGSALAEPNTLHFVVIGDLAFFYDMNSLGNRDMMANIRILLVNNGIGDEMRMPYSTGFRLHGEELPYVCAQGHYRAQNAFDSLAKAWCEALGFKYMSASSKQEYLERLPEFLTTQSDSPIILECHTTPDDDSQAGGALQLLDQDYVNKKKLKDAIKNVVPDSMLRTAKTILSRK